jgi:hypothetical protein
LKYRSLALMIDEDMRQCWVATQAQEYGWGGVRSVSRATGLSPHTIRKGLAELSGREMRHPANKNENILNLETISKRQNCPIIAVS